MKLCFGAYEVLFANGGIRVVWEEQTLYFNARPVYVSVKTYGAVNEFRDIPYGEVTEEGGAVTCTGVFVTANGSEIAVRDTYSAENGALKISRGATVLKAYPDDLGFQTKISFYQAATQELRDFEYFSPGQWYLDNRYAADFAPGRNMDLRRS